MLILSGSNTYTGGTTVNAGTLQVGSGGSGEGLLSSVTMSNNATVAFNHNDGLSYSGAISGSGQLVKLGTGNLDLVGTSSYSGPTTISAGTVELDGNGENLPTATALTIASGGVLDLAGVPQTVGSLSGSAGATITSRYSGNPTLTVAMSSGSTTTFAGNIISNDAPGAFRQRPVDPQRHKRLQRRDDGQRRHPGHRRPQRVVWQRVGDDRRRRAAGFRGAARASAPCLRPRRRSVRTRLSSAWQRRRRRRSADMRAHPETWRRSAALLHCRKAVGERAVGGTAAAVPEPGTIALLAAGILMLAVARWRRRS